MAYFRMYASDNHNDNGYFCILRWIVKRIILMFNYIWTFFINKIEVERVNLEKRLVVFAGYITLAGNQQWV